MVYLPFKSCEPYIVQILAVFIATLSMMSDGMQFAWPSPAIPRLLRYDTPVQMTREQSGWVTTSYITGNVLGVLLSISMFNKMSRKNAMLISAVPIAISWIGNLLANSFVVLLISRFIGGLGRNMIYVVVPMYIGEIADPKIRGILGAFVYSMMNMGVILVYAIAPFTPLFVSSVVGLLIILLQASLIKFIPESPYFFIKIGKYDDARLALQNLRGSENVDEEMKELETAMRRQTAHEGSFVQLFTEKSNRVALGIALILRAVQMMSGISVMTMHVHTIFSQASNKFPSEASALVYASMMFISCVCTMSVMDKYGRKPLMVFSSFATAFVLIALGIFFYAKQALYLDTHRIFWLPLFLMILFVLNYRLGLGTVPMVMVAELFPANVKVAGVVLSHLMYSFASFCSNVLFEYTEESFGMYTPFWVFGLLCILAGLFSLYCIPETKGKTLEEIQLILMKNHNNEERNVETFHMTEKA